jgi:hypothetical protein
VARPPRSRKPIFPSTGSVRRLEPFPRKFISAFLSRSRPIPCFPANRRKCHESKSPAALVGSPSRTRSFQRRAQIHARRSLKRRMKRPSSARSRHFSSAVKCGKSAGSLHRTTERKDDGGARPLPSLFPPLPRQLGIERRKRSMWIRAIRHVDPWRNGSTRIGATCNKWRLFSWIHSHVRPRSPGVDPHGFFWWVGRVLKRGSRVQWRSSLDTSRWWPRTKVRIAGIPKNRCFPHFPHPR